MEKEINSVMEKFGEIINLSNLISLKPGCFVLSEIFYTGLRRDREELRKKLKNLVEVEKAVKEMDEGKRRDIEDIKKIIEPLYKDRRNNQALLLKLHKRLEILRAQLNFLSGTSKHIKEARGIMIGGIAKIDEILQLNKNIKQIQIYLNDSDRYNFKIV